jgi:diguanylate cyclase (GGDEF)-like protein
MKSKHKKVKILIAEDDRISSKILEKHITGWGYDVLVAPDGKKAWQTFKKNEIGIALLDWMMPEITGIELCRKIRNDKSGKYTYIILLTAKKKQKDINKGLASGADEYLTKPFNPIELNARLKTGKRIIDLLEKLHKQAIHDGLTKVFNRREITRILNEEFLRAQRTNQPLSTIMLDIDHFKKVNDTYGHPVGDEVLVEIVSRITAKMRAYDKIGRYGGEEFIIILPHNSLKSVKKIAERIRINIAQKTIQTSVGPLQLTVSLGCTSTENIEASSTEMMIKISDVALYNAKNNGRNCTVVV